ncbi:hypothetical protein ACWTU6_10290 [Mesorhizobium sp. BHbsci]
MDSNSFYRLAGFGNPIPGPLLCPVSDSGATPIGFKTPAVSATFELIQRNQKFSGLERGLAWPLLLKGSNID